MCVCVLWSSVPRSSVVLVPLISVCSGTALHVSLSEMLGVEGEVILELQLDQLLMAWLRSGSRF